jgi:hypothetical protein
MTASAQSSSGFLPLPPARGIPATFSASLRSWYVNLWFNLVMLWSDNVTVGGQQAKREAQLPKNVSSVAYPSFDQKRWTDQLMILP